MSVLFVDVADLVITVTPFVSYKVQVIDSTWGILPFTDTSETRNYF